MVLDTPCVGYYYYMHCEGMLLLLCERFNTSLLWKLLACARSEVLDP